jgi:hypothetical protein
VRGLVGSVVCVVAAGGCNQAFDLERTEVIDAATVLPPDIDKDGLLDETDNCPQAANQDQTDGDADGFGDACDACPALVTTSNHDEDSDFRGDDCDVCPAVPDFQLDTDGNGIGNDCTTIQLPAPAKRLLFDSFVAIDDTRWRPGATPWQARGDSVSPANALPTAERGLELISAELKGNRWKITIGFASARPWVDGDYFGIVLTNPVDDTPFVSCAIRCLSGYCRNELITPNEMEIPNLNPSPLTRVFLEMHHDTQGNYDTLYCGHGNLYLSAGTATMLPSARVYVRATPDIQATYIDILE